MPLVRLIPDSDSIDPLDNSVQNSDTFIVLFVGANSGLGIYLEPLANFNPKPIELLVLAQDREVVTMNSNPLTFGSR